MIPHVGKRQILSVREVRRGLQSHVGLRGSFPGSSHKRVVLCIKVSLNRHEKRAPWTKLLAHIKRSELSSSALFTHCERVTKQNTYFLYFLFTWYLMTWHCERRHCASVWWPLAPENQATVFPASRSLARVQFRIYMERYGCHRSGIYKDLLR